MENKKIEKKMENTMIVPNKRKELIQNGNELEINSCVKH